MEEIQLYHDVLIVFQVHYYYYRIVTYMVYILTSFGVFYPYCTLKLESEVSGISKFPSCGVLLPSNPGTSVEGDFEGLCSSSFFPSCHRYLCAGEVFLDWRSLLVPCSLFERSFSLHPIPIRRRARSRAQPIQIRLKSTTLLSVQPGLINR